ncbi:hypothetical protein [Candidatus Phycosocius bacilliformis]|uniref:hypothetical protein n=1 Tax=Candidatus Phycosocius bacilliformis TaxID=1445552 RepID=UPI0010578271|nr:hypothetical protein [Candidatus Phycosocius bacilliformis]
MNVLIKMAEWQKIVALAERVPELEKRIAALEAGRNPPKSKFSCAVCGAAAQVVSEKPHPTFHPFGDKQLTVKCNNPNCGVESTRRFNPSEG